MSKQYGDIVWRPQEHGRISRISRNDPIDYAVPAATRGIDMLLAKYHGRPFQTEVQFLKHSETQIPVLSKPLALARIAFVTDGGLVPKGNPDMLPPVNSGRFCIYSFFGADRLLPERYEISHQGYDNQYISQDPNRLIPLDAAREAAARGRLGKLFDFFYTTAGVMTPVESSQNFGRLIASSLCENEIDGVILTSTCGTSTRCGAYIACEIERKGIPVVQVTNLAHIPEWVGCSRILCGNAVYHVFGNPDLPPEMEKEYRRELFEKALKLLEATPTLNSSLIVK